MSRIRTVKPEFWTSAQVIECSLNARLLFIGLWNFCDDAGRHPASAKQAKAEVFPADPLTVDDVARMIAELSANDLIRLYTVDGKDYFYVTGWRHQKIDKSQKPKYPEPLDEHSTNIRSGYDRKGYEPNGGDIPPEDVSRETEKVPTRLPEDYDPDLGVALSHGIPLTAAIGEAKKFKNHFAGVPDDAGLKLDWDATWDNWCIRAAEFRLKDGKPLANGKAARPTRWVLADDRAAWAEAVEGWKADHDGKPPPKVAGLGGLGWHFPVREAVAA